MVAASPIHLLYAEDNDGDVDLLRIACADRHAPVEIDQVVDGNELLARIAAQPDPWPWQAVLVDLNLPQRSGLSVLGQLAPLAASRRVPVLVLTSSEWIGDRDRALALGAREVLVKPDSFLGFNVMLDRILRHCRLG